MNLETAMETWVEVAAEVEAGGAVGQSADIS